MRTLAAAALAASLAAAAPAAAQLPESAPITKGIEGAVLTVSADGEVKTSPDMATINAGVITEAATADAAMAENATRMTGVMAALKKAGVAERDIQTSNLQLNPQYRYEDNQPPKLTGYQATNTVTVKVRNLKGLGKAIDAVVAQGGNQLYGVGFGVDKPDPVLDQARTEAIKKARARADLYATAAGLKVHRILAISEGGGYAPPPYPIPMYARAEAMSAAPPTPVAPGEVSLSASVSVTFELR